MFNGAYPYNISKFSGVKVITFVNEEAMCNAFIRTYFEYKNTLTFLIGFTSSSEFPDRSGGQMNYSAVYGYDLNFIVSRSAYKLTPRNKLVKSADDKLMAYQTIGFNEMPKVYCMDASVMLKNQLQQAQLNDMTGFKLNDYLKLYNLPLKHNNDLTYVRM